MFLIMTITFLCSRVLYLASLSSDLPDIRSSDDRDLEHMQCIVMPIIIILSLECHHTE